MSLLTVIADIERTLAVRRSMVLFITLWMTWRAFEWAAHYALTGIETNGAAAIILAVTAPVAYLQKEVFSAYIRSKEK